MVNKDISNKDMIKQLIYPAQFDHFRTIFGLMGFWSLHPFRVQSKDVKRFIIEVSALLFEFVLRLW